MAKNNNHISVSTLTGSGSVIETLSGSISANDGLRGNLSGNITMSGGVSSAIIEKNMNYEKLINLPQIEGVTLIGNKSYEELNLSSLSNSELEDLLSF